MVSVSTLISELDGVAGPRFINSLAIVNNYAKKDTAMNVSLQPHSQSTAALSN